MNYSNENKRTSNGVSKIEQQVMASVAVIYTAQRLTSAFALKVYGLALSFAGVAAFVSLTSVAANFATVAHGGVVGMSAFLLSAVLGTKLVVQLALLVGALALVSLMVDAVRSLVQPVRGFAA